MIAIREGGVVPGLCTVLPKFDIADRLDSGCLLVLFDITGIHTLVLVVTAMVYYIPYKLVKRGYLISVYPTIHSSIGLHKVDIVAIGVRGSFTLWDVFIFLFQTALHNLSLLPLVILVNHLDEVVKVKSPW